MKRALVVSVAAEALTTLAMLLTFKLAAQEWGTTGLSEWVLARRVVTLVIPAAIFGLDISLTLALARQVRNASEMTGYLVSAIPPVLAGAAFVALLMLAFPESASTLLFGSSAHQGLLWPVAAMIFALAWHVVVFAFLRGTLHFVAANSLHVIVYGVLPVGAILIAGVGPRGTLLALAGSIVLAVLAFGFPWLRLGARGLPIKETCRELVQNGAPRVPAAFAVLALFGVPPLAVAHTDGLIHAGFVSLGMSLITIAGSAFSPLAFVLLPIAARARAAQNTNALLSRVAYLIPFALIAGAAFALFLFLAADFMSQALIGESDPKLAHIFRWVGAAAIPYVYFVCVRPVVDAHAPSSTITRLVLVALATYLACCGVSFYVCGIDALDSALIGHICSMYALGVGTFFEFRRIIRWDKAKTAAQG